MSTFNTSTKREDVSTRLKAQNLKNARDQTKQLEEESRKMEDRLRELKMAMGREKENRERQGGFWKTGQTGTLHSYAQDVLDAKPPKQQRSKSGSAKVKVHVLKDEPINIPQRNRGPGTMGYIASKRVSPKDGRQKGNQCGQCEGRGAAVTCIQCSEDYCAGCFAAFHLKGALKKHRSVPIQANTPRHSYSPRVSSPSPRCSEPSHLPAGAVTPTNPNNQRITAPHSGSGPEGASGAFERPSLLQGDYDESGSAASFQEALKAWRTGEDTNSTPRTEGSLPGGQTRSQETRNRNTHKRKQIARSVEHSTSTSNARVDNPVDVTFQEHGISYAERLLLKRHRRTEVDEYPTNSSWGDCGSAGQSQLNGNHRPSFYDQDGTLVTDRGHVDFRSLYYTVMASECERARSGAESALSIIELPGVPYVSVPESTGRCHVEEVDSAPGEAFLSSSETELHRQIVSPKPMQSRIAFVDYSDSSQEGIPPFDRHVPLQTHYSDTSLTSPYGRSYTPRGSKSCTTPYITEPDAEIVYKRPSEYCGLTEETPTSDMGEGFVIKEKEIKRRPGTGKSRPQSRAARPKSGARAKSRAESRATSLRLGSRSSMYGEGLLTKAPSEKLHEIAQLSSPADVPAVASLSGFFLAGLDSEGREKTVTEDPTNARLKQHRVSHRLYQMGPRSWRPNSSLGESIPLDQVATEGSQELTLSYTYSGQIEGSPVEVHTGTPLTSELNGADTTLVVRPPSAPRIKKTPSPRNARVKKHKGDDRCVSSHSDHQVDSPPDCGRLSRAIVLDGEDLSRYDTDSQALLSEQAEDDGDTLNRLEWELASETGRITAEGKLSRLELISSDDEEMTEEMLSGRLSQLRTPGPGYDIDTHLNETELMDNFEEMERQLGDEEAVKRLQ